MNSLPLHSAAVHIPLGLAVVLPVVAFVVAWTVLRGTLPRAAWGLVVGLQVVTLLAGFAALRTGKMEAERLRAALPHDAVEAHEESAESFLVAAGIAVALGGAALFVSSSSRLFRPALLVGALATVPAAGLAAVAGHEGGKLVWIHDAPGAATRAAPTPQAPAST